MVEPGRVRRAAFLAGALIALATLPVSEAAADDIVVRAAAGIGQVVKADRWMPIVIDVDSSQTSFTGELVVSWGDVRVRRTLLMPSAGRHQFELYLRTAEPESTVRVRLLSGGRELKAIEMPVRIVPASDPVTLCIGASDVSGQEDCVKASADSLPRSPRAYDAVDRVVISDAIASLSREQREALAQSTAIHSLNVSGDSGLVNRPFRPQQHAGLPIDLMRATGAFTLLFVICFAGAGLWQVRRGTTVRWLWLSAAAIVAIGAVGVQAISAIGPGTAITVHHRTLVEQIPGTDASVLSMRAVAEFPSHGVFTLRLPVTDGSLEPSSSGAEPAEQLLDESGQPVLSGAFGLAARKAFSAEAITTFQPLAVSVRGNTWSVTNRSSIALHGCHYGDGFSDPSVAAMSPGRTLEAQETGEGVGPAFICETADPIVPMASDRTVHMQGTTVIAVYRRRQAIPTTGAR